MTTTSLDQLRQSLAEHAAHVDDAALSPVARAHAVTRQARVRRRRRAGVVLVAGLAGGAAVAAVVVQGPALDVGPAPAPDAPSSATTSPTDAGPQPQWVAGVHYPGTLRVDGSTYWLGNSYVPSRGGRAGTVQTVPYDTPRVLSWSTPPSTRGFVSVRVDGMLRSRSTAGALESGLVLTPGRAHRIVVSVPALRRNEQIGIVLYDRPGE